MTIYEIGAVTPYYWPGRVTHVVDPADSHHRVTIRSSIFDVDLSGHAVLSISTLEHIGNGDYGLERDASASEEAFKKIFSESPAFFLTVPVGFNSHCDSFVLNKAGDYEDVEVRYLCRQTGNAWSEVTQVPEEQRKYGPEWANSVAVLQRGGLL